MRHRVTLADDAGSFACDEDLPVLLAMRDVNLACLPVGCRSGGCGVCRVQVLSGSFDTGVMSAAQITPADRAQGVVLACRLYPRSDLRLRRMARPLPAAGLPCGVENWPAMLAMRSRP